jgi:hypothetical protein
MELPTHIKAQVEAGCPLDEALATAAIEALESDPQGALTALEYLAELAELQSPHLTVTVRIGAAGKPVGPPKLPAPAPIPPSEAPAHVRDNWLLAGAYWPR